MFLNVHLTICIQFEIIFKNIIFFKSSINIIYKTEVFYKMNFGASLKIYLYSNSPAYAIYLVFLYIVRRSYIAIRSNPISLFVFLPRIVLEALFFKMRSRSTLWDYNLKIRGFRTLINRGLTSLLYCGLMKKKSIVLSLWTL